MSDEERPHVTNHERLTAFLDGLDDAEHTFATRLLAMGADYPLVYVAIHLDRRMSDLSRPPWKGIPHALGGMVGGAIAAFFGIKGAGG